MSATSLCHTCSLPRSQPCACPHIPDAGKVMTGHGDVCDLVLQVWSRITNPPRLDRTPQASALSSVARLPRTLEDQDGPQPHQHPHTQPSPSLHPLAEMKTRSRRRKMPQCPPAQRPAALPEQQVGPSWEPPPCKRKLQVPREEGERRASPLRHLPEGIVASARLRKQRPPCHGKVLQTSPPSRSQC